MKFNDVKVHLHGSTAALRSEAAALLATSTALIDGKPICDFVARPDLTHDPGDIAIVFGVPVYNTNLESVALRGWFQQRVDKIINGLKVVEAFRDIAITTAAYGSHDMTHAPSARFFQVV